jgi:signal transduction histidine kinase
VDAGSALPQYRRGVSHGPGRESSQTDQLRALVPAFALVVAVVAATTDPSTPGDLVLAVLPVGAFAAWAYIGGVPLPVLSIVVLAPVVAAQRDGQLEPLLFDASVLGFVVGRWAPSLVASVLLGLLVMSSPVAAGLLQNPTEIGVGIWILGTAFPWGLGRAMAHQRQLTIQLDATRRELAQQALLAERRQIARDVHDSVGHGVAAMMLQVTSARHVLRRDPAAAEEALRSAEEVGRRSMQELRRTVALLRRDDESGVPPPPPSARDIATLVDHARAGGLDVELQTRGDLGGLAPSVGVALYRIAQEAVGNAARHSPQARTLLGIEVGEGRASLVAETRGATRTRPAGDVERPGYGLVGMRERATALGGDFAAGPTPEGWRVSCRLPLDVAAAVPAGEARDR